MKRRLFLEWLLLLSSGVVLAVFAAQTRITQKFDAILLDLSASASRAPPAQDITIVAIDDRSLEQLGAWPWRRSLHAQIIDRLDSAGARLILYDVLFIDPTDRGDDLELAGAIGNAGSVVLPLTFGPKPNQQAGLQAIRPIPVLAEAALAQGHVVVEPDADGVVRRLTLYQEADGQAFPQFVANGLKALPASRQQQNAKVTQSWPVRPVISAHSPGTYPALSAADVALGNVPQEFLRDRIVLVGATAQGMGDRHSVASRSAIVMPGVELQANLFDALRSGTAIRQATAQWSIGLAALALLLQFLVFWRLPPRTALGSTVLIAASCLLVPAAIIPLARFWVAPGSAILLVLFAYPFWSWRRLTAVSSYLEQEAVGLEDQAHVRKAGEGFDHIARQVSRMSALIGHVNQSFAFLRSVIEAAPDAIIVFDEDDGIAMANQRFLDLMPAYDQGKEVRFHELLEQSGVRMEDESRELGMPDGRIFLVAREHFRMQGRQGNWGIVSLRDVTELRRRDQEWREMLEFLSHDMRTPQVAIMGLLGRAAESDDPTGEIGDRIRAQAEKTLKLADDFVHLARLNETEITFEEADIASLVEEACDTAYAQARQKNIRLDADLPEDGQLAWVDPALIARLLDNLIGNAIKYSPVGSTIRISAKDAGEGRSELIVEDNGPGLPKDRLTAPFKRFGSRLEPGTSAGLGLAFVRKVVDRHCGVIDVKSAEGSGTRFRIEFPPVPPSH